MSCVTKKKKSETSKFGKFYQNTTAYYNGYWNSKEILKESMKTLRLANVDDYNQILAVEDFVSLDNPKMVKADMDKIIEKVTTVAQLHEPSDWLDDCYVMMAKAQYLKQEYETAEETLEYFQEDFNPSNPYGRNYKSKKPTGKAAKKAKEAEKKEKDEAKQKAKQIENDIKEEKAKAKVEEIKAKRDEEIAKVFKGESDKFLLVIGPCSADRHDAVLDYIHRLAMVQTDVEDKILIIPRIYTGKPRTTGAGYKGMLH